VVESGAVCALYSGSFGLVGDNQGGPGAVKWEAKMNLTYLEIDHQRSHFDRLSGPARDAFVDRLIFSWLYHDHALEGVVLTRS
jgi:hypothetical protein